MSFTSEVYRSLFRLYEHYVGEPDSGKDVYGYTLFILGYIVASVGVLTFVVGYAGDADSYTLIRISGVAAATGLAFCLFGIGLMLPVRRRGIQASVVGLVVSLAGVAAFAVVYPYNWRQLGMGLDVEVIAIYTSGIAIITGVTALVPVLTGRKGMFVEEEKASEDPPILTGDALEDAQFAVFRNEHGDWKWNVLHREALATSNDSAVTRPEAEEGIERVKSQISSAGLMELTTSAFRLYEDRDGTWQWTLARDDGSVVGSCSGDFDRRDGAEESVSFLKDRGPEADIIEIEGAAFTYTEERDRWYWQLVDDDHTVLATSEDGHESQEAAEDAARTFAERFEQARILDIERLGVELYERASGWSWRFVDDSDDVIATAATEFSSRRSAEDAAEQVLPDLGSAPVTVAGEPAFERYKSDDEWEWRLVDGTEHVVSRSPEPSSESADASRETDKFSANARDADVVQIEGAEYEVFPGSQPGHPSSNADNNLPATVEEAATDGGTTVEEGANANTGPDWNWRLVTEDREVIAASTEPHTDDESAADAIRRMREQAREADLIEFEQSAFQVYEADDGEWRWRLIDEDGNVLADSGEEHTSRGEAAEAMMTLKEQAPDAELLEIETAAFELFVTEDDEWGWRLIDAGGKLVAEDPTTHPTRDDARDAMNRLLEHLESDIRTMEHAIFQLYADDDWHWKFVLPSNETVAVDDDPSPTRDELVESLPAVREAAASARDYAVGDVTVQLYESSGWHWRLLDRDREELADSNVRYDDRDTTLDRVTELKDAVDNAPIFTIEDAVVRVNEVDGEEDGDADSGWQWDLVDADREAFATGADAKATKDELLSEIEEVRQLAPMAGRVDFDVASFELMANEDDRWSWRLLDEDGREVATGSETYESNAAARDALEEVRDLIERASILEIDSVSFELHTAEDGWVWQLVDKYGAEMAESTQTYESRTEAREAMNDVKAHAPDGWITFTE